MIDSITPDSEASTRLSKLKGIQSISDRGIRYERRWTDCGSKKCYRCSRGEGEKRVPSHGPYWYMIAHDPVTKRRRTIYLGHTLDTTLYRTEKGGFNHDAYERRLDSKQQAAEVGSSEETMAQSGDTAGTETTPLL